MEGKVVAAASVSTSPAVSDSKSGEPLLHEDPSEIVARDVLAVQQIKSVPTLLDVLCDITGMGFAAVARVSEKSWTLCVVKDDIHFGLCPGSQLDVETTLCMEVRRSGQPIVIEHATLDPRYTEHHTLRLYKVERYVSMPIILAGGRYFGNLCALDPCPANISAPAVNTFVRFASLIAMHLDNEISRENAEMLLRDERLSSELREQFIAILGHDLRNPLQAIHASSDLLVRKASDPVTAAMAARIKANSKRMSSLIDDVLDFARGRLGGGVGLNLADVDDINAAISSVVRELEDGQPGRRIDCDFRVHRTVRCDLGRMQQVASNLVGNALTHGAADKAVQVVAREEEHEFVLEVWNAGDPISPEHLPKVFEPFWRRDTSTARAGLGLGLHICAQIVRAHGGKLDVTSSGEAGTTFTARIPLHLVP